MVLGAGGIEIANRHKKVVGKAQAQGSVDFIHKHHNRLGHFRQHHLLKKAGQPLGKAQVTMLLPPVEGVGV